MTSRSRGVLALTGLMEQSRPIQTSIDGLLFSLSLSRTRYGADDQSLGGHGMRPHGVAHNGRTSHAGVFGWMYDAPRLVRREAATRCPHPVPQRGGYHTGALRAWALPRPRSTTFQRPADRRVATTPTRHARTDTDVGMKKGKHSDNPVVNIPNALSMARLLSGPAIGHLIVTDNLSLAIPCLIISALTDWLDGYAARKTNTVNVLGSYLDPLADKVLVGSVAISMGYTGLLDPWLFGLIIGRDACIVVGSFGLRWRRFGYGWPDGGWKEFFNVAQEAAEHGAAGNVARSTTTERLDPIGTSKARTNTSDTTDRTNTT
ncbi:MAG: CDP-alcohol phosphatidyltransferase family protein, partial [bacterium]